MQPVKCPNSHYYDADTYSECPHCLENGIVEQVSDEIKGKGREKKRGLFGKIGSKNKEKKESGSPSIARTSAHSHGLIENSLENDNLSNETFSLESREKEWQLLNNTSVDEADSSEMAGLGMTMAMFSDEQFGEEPENAADPTDLGVTMAMFSDEQFGEEPENVADPTDLGVTMAMFSDEQFGEEPENTADPTDLGVTMAMFSDGSAEENEEESEDPAEDEREAERQSSFRQAVSAANSSGIEQDTKTIGYFNVDSGTDPVVGWLVCVQGAYFGESFPLHEGNNNIGRALRMDISLPNEPTVSRDRHAIILFEPIKREFILQAGISKGLTYLNDSLVVAYNTLHSYDQVRIGKALFLFVPFCSERFSWDAYAE